MYNLKLVFRNLKKQWLSSMINTTGLILGLTVSIIIAFFIEYEFSFENFNPDKGKIYRLLMKGDESRFPIQSIAFLKRIRENIPELKESTMVQYRENDFFKVNNDNILINDILFTDDNFLKLFKIHQMSGEKEPLSSPLTALISESEAQKLFPHQDAIGKTIQYQGQYTFEIRGIFKDVPLHSNYRPAVIMNIESKKIINSFEYENLGNSSSVGYYYLPGKVNTTLLYQKIIAQAKEIFNIKNFNAEYEFQPLSDIHLNSADTEWDAIERSDIKTVRTFAIIAALIMIIVTFNFINLSLALRSKRNFTTGIQKILGAGKSGILGYLLTETAIITITGFVLALLFAGLLIPAFNQLMGTRIHFSLLNKTVLILACGVIVLNILIPVLVQLRNRMRVNPVASVKSGGRESGKPIMGWLTGLLSTVQLAVVIGLIAAIFLINEQFNLILKEKLGFDKSNLVSITNVWNGDPSQVYKVFKSELLKSPKVVGVSGCWNSPGENLSNGGWLISNNKGEERKTQIRLSPSDQDFFKVADAKFILGKSFGTTDSSKMVINRKCMQQLGVDNPVGMKVVLQFDSKTEYEICGVIDDIQYNSLHTETEPAVYILNAYLYNIIVRLAPGNTVQNVAFLKENWDKLNTGQAFKCDFIDQCIANNYKREIRTRNLLMIMSVIAVLISMLGVFGYTTFRVQSKTKEIGIRKVNGAKITEILTLLNKTYLRWVLIAFVVSVPVTIYAIQSWLSHFAYKTTLSWWIFVLAGCITLLIAMLTVSFQSWRAATRNPAEVLRYE